jgi:hypothetical protein
LGLNWPPNGKAWSLALECRNFNDSLSSEPSENMAVDGLELQICFEYGVLCVFSVF